MENRFKLRISRMFRSSFGSCRSRNIPDNIEKPVFVPQNRQNFHMIEPPSPKRRPFPSLRRPRCPENDEPVKNSCIVSKEAFPRQKVSERCSLFVPAAMKGRMCPPASPVSPLNTYYKFHEFDSKEKETQSKKKKKKTTKIRVKNKEREACLFNSFSGETICGSGGNGGWFSSEDEREDETETLFSSKSLSSDSSTESHRTLHRRKAKGTSRRRGASKSSELGVLPLQGKVKDSFAVVKRSSDPYSDFKTSMVEMVVEKQIYAAKDLEQLLQCFLSLNSYHHHRVIIEVFTEIWEALFSN